MRTRHFIEQVKDIWAGSMLKKLAKAISTKSKVEVCGKRGNRNHKMG